MKCKREKCKGSLIMAPLFVVEILNREVKKYYPEIKENVFICNTCEYVHRTDGSLLTQARFAVPGAIFYLCLKKAKEFREKVCQALLEERKKYLISAEKYSPDIKSFALFSKSGIAFLQITDFIHNGKKSKEIEKFDITEYLNRDQ